jgi:hypothetical protein
MQFNSAVLPAPFGPTMATEFPVVRLEADTVERREVAELKREILNFPRHQPHQRRLRRYCLMSR